LERCSDAADPVVDDLLLVQDVAALLYVPATREVFFPEIMPAQENWSRW
jgi:hypothetical protein